MDAEEGEGDEEQQQGNNPAPTGAAVALSVGKSFGVPLVAGGMLAAFGLFM